MKKISALLFTLLLNQGCGGGSSSGDSNSGTYGVSGTISGLAGDITLSLNGTKETFTDNGAFNFETRVNDGENYQVTISGTSQGLTCGLTNQAGQSEQDVTNVAVSCSGKTPTAYNLSGLAFNTEEPSIVTFAFHLVDRFTGLAVDTLNSDNVTDYLKVLENGTNISPTESFLELDRLANVNASYHTVFAVDVSGSVNSKLPEIKNLILNAIYDETTAESKLGPNQFVSIITFDSEIKTVVNKTQDAAKIIEGLDDMMGTDTSTNLYGAIKQGVELWDNEISIDAISYGSLILFTDGNDNSGIVSKSDSLNAVGNKDIFFITIGDLVDFTILKEFTHENNIFSAEDFEQLSDSLEDAFTRVKTYEDGLYVMSYASPKRAGSNTLTVSAIDDYRCDTAISEYEELQLDNSGNVNNCADQHSYEFNANNFSATSPTLEIVGPSFTTSPEVSLQAALRWSHDKPDFDWQVKVCSGNVTETRSTDLSSITFTRNTESLAVIELEVYEINSEQSKSQYLVMTKDSDDSRYLTPNTLVQICSR